MRILIVAPPKTGNSWLKCLFSAVYELDWLTSDRVPGGTSLEAFAAWLASQGFPDNAVFHHHYDYSPQLAELATRNSIHLATILRDPYDMFVSRYFFAQAQADNEKPVSKAVDRTPDVMVGKAIDDPVVLAYLADNFGSQLQKGIDWLESGASVVVRYERLVDWPEEELTHATEQIQSAAPDRVQSAIEACQAENLLRTRKGLNAASGPRPRGTGATTSHPCTSRSFGIATPIASGPSATRCANSAVFTRSQTSPALTLLPAADLGRRSPAARYPFARTWSHGAVAGTRTDEPANSPRLG